ncbi:MAG: V-type ATP synthase subunit B, partial [Candidatus Firestonebacteria bacterium]|nr:V-type ATP synthase subunit B [Candidatus Firestonebacteria bacterium]
MKQSNSACSVENIGETLKLSNLSSVEYRTVKIVSGPLIFVENIPRISYAEIIEIIAPTGISRTGQVMEIGAKKAMIQVFEGTEGLDTKRTIIRLKTETPHIDVSFDLIGRTLNGMGKPIDGLPPIIPEERVQISGYPINPYLRERPADYIETGIAVIDVMNTLLKGQKLAIFSCSGLPANQIATHIVKHAKIGDGDNFIIIFVAMGITNQEKSFFMN